MAGRDRVLSIASRRALRAVREYGEAAMDLRLGLGLSRRALAAELGISESKLARWEKGEPPHPDLFETVVLMRVLGHDYVGKWYPVDGGLRDVAHARLVGRFVERLPADLPRRLEVPIPIQGDLRAWDVVFPAGPRLVGVAAETRLHNWQALLRREELKMRDSHVDRLLLVLLNSAANRRAVADAGNALRVALPLDGRTIFAALRAGRDPGANGLIFI